MRPVIPFGRRREIPDPRRVAAFAETAGRLQREREAAPPVVDRLLAESGSADLESLAGRPELRSSGVLDHLTMLIAEELVLDPAYAERLAILAVEIAERLPRSEYPAVVIQQLRARALVDLAKARRALAQLDLAIEALERAAVVLPDWLAHDRALVAIELALTYREMGWHPAGVRVLLADCAKTLREHGDRTRAARAEALMDGMGESR